MLTSSRYVPLPPNDTVLAAFAIEFQPIATEPSAVACAPKPSVAAAVPDARDVLPTAVAPTPVACASAPMAVALFWVACESLPSAIDKPPEAVVSSLASIFPSALRSIAPPNAVALSAVACA